jgi:SecD/SecF fusion protein
MAVDANVLIFERIREEMDRGAALRMAIRNGFGRATRTIVDANFTTLITGIVLYVVGTDQIKGFAVTLILGIVMSMYTAIFCSRVIFDIGEKKRWITKLSMTRILGKTNIDFLGKQRIGIACSLLLAIVGMFGVFTRGSDLLDIDLSGGVAIEVVFKEPGKTEVEIRKALEAYSDTLPKGEQLTPLSVTGIGTEGTNFGIETRRDELKPVKDAIENVFGEALSTNSLSYDPSAIKAIGAGAASESGEAGEQPSTGNGDATNGATNVPPDGDGARLDLPPLSLVALAEDDEIDKTTATDADASLGTQTSDDPPSAAADPSATKTEDASPATANDAAAASDDDDAAEAASNADPNAANQPDTPPAEAEPAETQPSPTDAAGDAQPDGANEGITGDAKDDAKDAGPPVTTTPPPTDSPPAGDTAEDQPAEVDPAIQRFAGGSEVRLKLADPISRPTLKEMLGEIIKSKDLTADMELVHPEIDLGSMQRTNEWTLRSTLSVAQTDSVLKVLQTQLAAEPHFPTATTIGGQVAGNTQFQGLAAMIASLVFIVAYIWIRFQQVSYGLAAVVALVHDVLITLGLIALSAYVAEIPVISQALQLESFKISLPILAAFLTIIGYSLNDTIVVFDRIREVKGKSPYLTADMVNTSINQTLSRTLLTSFTTWIVVVILYFIGGAGIHGFAFSLVIGVIVGTYSSIFIASPALLWMRQISSPGEPTPASAGAKVPVAG